MVTFCLSRIIFFICVFACCLKKRFSIHYLTVFLLWMNFFRLLVFLLLLIILKLLHFSLKSLKEIYLSFRMKDLFSFKWISGMSLRERTFICSNSSFIFIFHLVGHVLSSGNNGNPGILVQGIGTLTEVWKVPPSSPSLFKSLLW